MKRAVGGVVVGYLLWTVLWLGGNALLFSEANAVVGAGQPYVAIGPLVGVLALSVVCSLAAGLAGATTGGRRGVPLIVMAVLLLLTGVAVQAGVWTLMPRWYHATFLVLIVPVVLLGGRLAGGTARLSGR